MYSRLAPQRSISPGPRNSTRSCSSRMYCWTFFQFSSRRVSTCAMNASSSAVGAGAWAKARRRASPTPSATAVVIFKSHGSPRQRFPDQYTHRWPSKGAPIRFVAISRNSALISGPPFAKVAPIFLPDGIEFHHARPRACRGAFWTLREEPCMRTMFVVGFLLLVGIPAVAQETRSTISGTVRDEQGVIPGATRQGHQPRHRCHSAAHHQHQRILRSPAAQRRHLRGRRRDDGLQDPSPNRRDVVLRPGAQRAAHARDRHDCRGNHRHRRGAAAGGDHAAARAGAGREEDRGASASVEHAGALRAVRTRHDGEGRDSLRRPGIRRRAHDQCHTSRRCRRRRLVDRWGDKQRCEPADVYLSEH